MAAQDRIFAWVVVQEEGTDVLSPASQVWKSSQHPDLPFDIDALKNAVKAEFALRLQHVDAADQKVYAANQEQIEDLLVHQAPAGATRDNPLVVKYPPPSTAKTNVPEHLEEVLLFMRDKQEAEQEASMYTDKQTMRETASQHNFKEELISHYQVCKQQGKGGEELECMVTKQFVPRDKCIAGHLLPHSNRTFLPSYGLSHLAINDVRNGILWAIGIEQKFHPPKEICLLYDPFASTWKFTVLNPLLRDKIIAGTNKTFGELHLQPVQFPHGKSPWKRILWVHAKLSIENALLNKWIEATEWEGEIEKFADLLRLRREQKRGEESDAAVTKWLESTVCH